MHEPDIKNLLFPQEVHCDELQVRQSVVHIATLNRKFTIPNYSVEPPPTFQYLTFTVESVCRTPELVIENFSS